MSQATIIKNQNSHDDINAGARILANNKWIDISKGEWMVVMVGNKAIYKGKNGRKIVCLRNVGGREKEVNRSCPGRKEFIRKLIKFGLLLCVASNFFQKLAYKNILKKEILMRVKTKIILKLSTLGLLKG